MARPRKKPEYNAEMINKFWGQTPLKKYKP